MAATIDILRSVLLDFVCHIQFMMIAASLVRSSWRILTVSWCTIGTGSPGWSLSVWLVPPQFKKEFLFVKFACLLRLGALGSRDCCGILLLRKHSTLKNRLDITSEIFFCNPMGVAFLLRGRLLFLPLVYYQLKLGLGLVLSISRWYSQLMKSQIHWISASVIIMWCWDVRLIIVIG